MPPEADVVEKTLEQKVAEAALAQAGAAEKAKGDDQGGGDEDAEGKERARGEDGRFKSMRRRIESAERVAVEKDQRIAKLEGRLEQVLDLVEKRVARSEVDADPLSHLKPDDPDRDLLSGKVKPLLDRTLGPLTGQIAEIKKALDELRGQGRKSAEANERVAEMETAFASIAEDHGLPDGASKILGKYIIDGRVTGRTYGEAFDNALTYHRGKFAGKEAGKAEAAEKASLGGVMPGMVSSPEPSGDFKTLRRSYREARETGDGTAEDRLFQDLFRRAQEEQGR